jgi:aminoglycoside phosphotransferase (APT) family kinase protein
MKTDISLSFQNYAGVQRMVLVSKEAIEQELKRVFPDKKIEAISFLKNHSVNRLVRFIMNDDQFVMKILTREPQTAHELYRLEKEFSILEQFDKRNTAQGLPREVITKVPIPKPIFLQNDKQFIGKKYEILSFVDGDNLEAVWGMLSEKEKISFTKKIAELLKGIHSIEFNMFGEIEEYSHPRCFYSMNSYLKSTLSKNIGLLRRTNKMPIALLTKAQIFVEQHLEKIAYQGKPKLVHNDINKTNFIINKTKTDEIQIKAILDFEWSYAGDPVIDILETFTEILESESLFRCLTKEYYGEEKKLDDFSLYNRIYTILNTINSLAVGWIHFHPTKENLLHAKNLIEGQIRLNE